MGGLTVIFFFLKGMDTQVGYSFAEKSVFLFIRITKGF